MTALVTLAQASPAGVIGPDTLAPIGSAVLVITAVLFAWFGINRRLERMEDRMARSWSVQHQQIFELRLRLTNPSIDVPDTMMIAHADDHKNSTA
jgi:hypothetical protein